MSRIHAAVHMSKLLTCVLLSHSVSVRDSEEKVTNVLKTDIEKRETNNTQQFILLVWISSQPHQCSVPYYTIYTYTTHKKKHRDDGGRRIIKTATAVTARAATAAAVATVTTV